MNGNRKTGFNIPLRKVSIGFGFPEVGQKKTNKQKNWALKIGNSRPLIKWKITNHAEEERKSVEGEKIDKVRVTVSNDPNMFEKVTFYQARRSVEREAVCSRACRSAARLFYVQLIFF